MINLSTLDEFLSFVQLRRQMLQDSVNSLNLTEKYNSKHYLLFLHPQNFFIFSPATALIFLNITIRTTCRFPICLPHMPHMLPTHVNPLLASM